MSKSFLYFYLVLFTIVLIALYLDPVIVDTCLSCDSVSSPKLCLVSQQCTPNEVGNIANLFFVMLWQDASKLEKNKK